MRKAGELTLQLATAALPRGLLAAGCLTRNGLSHASVMAPGLTEGACMLSSRGDRDGQQGQDKVGCE